MMLPSFYVPTGGVDSPEAARARAAAAVGGVLAVSLLASPSIGTAIESRMDLRTILDATTINPGIRIQGAPRQVGQAPTMRRILELSGLSRRGWAEILGVSHTTIANWSLRDPADATRLVQLRDDLEQARRFHADLGQWLSTPLPGVETTPLELLTDGRSRAFRGAVRAGVGPAPSLSREELAARVRSDVAWPVAEVATARDEQS